MRLFCGQRTGHLGLATVSTMALLFGLAWQISHVDAATVGPPSVETAGESQVDTATVADEAFVGDLLTYVGYQYAAWHSDDHCLVLARRQVSDDSWETLTLAQRLAEDETPEEMVLGISPLDGRLHVLVVLESHLILYTRSGTGLLNAGTSSGWDPGLFAPVRGTLDGTDLGALSSATFVLTSSRVLQLSYRVGTDGQGGVALAEYQASWTVLGTWHSTFEMATMGAQLGAERHLCSFGIVYGSDGRAHIMFTWDETTSEATSGGTDSADAAVGYIYSDDDGRTWLDSSGDLVAETGTTLQLRLGAPGLAIGSIGGDRGALCAQGEAVDSSGLPHVLNGYPLSHLFLGPEGTWHGVETPVAMDAGRFTLVLDSSGNAYAIASSGRIVAASAADQWTDWAVTYDGPEATGEVVVDPTRAASEGALSIMYWNVPDGAGAPVVRVVDLLLGV